MAHGKAIVACRLVAAAVIGWAGATKFLATPGNVDIFTQLGMEPVGRLLIGGIEVAAAVMLLVPGFAAFGALLTVGTMFGAVLAPAPFLGAGVGGDGGLHLVLLAIVLASAGPVLVVLRRNLPIIGNTL